MIVLTICVTDQDSTQTTINQPDTSSRDSKKCVVKQSNINRKAEQVNSKLGDIHVKYDKSIDEILKLLDEKDEEGDL